VADPLPDELLELMEKLAADLPQLPDSDEAMRRFEWLLDALIVRQQVPPRFRALAKKIQADRGIRLRLSLVDDKYGVESPDVDCAALIPLCGARCCGFEVVLSRQDLAEQKLPFVIDQPYVLRRDPATKRCACMDTTGGCTVYEHRPATCRTYDCREDRRVWLDYDQRIPAPMPDELRPEPTISGARDEG
jgi:Fe-S-cluster containining protein